MARNKYNVDEELDAPFNFKQLKRGLAYVLPYKKNLAFSFSCAIVSILLGLLTPMFMQLVIDELIPNKRTTELVAYSIGFACMLIVIVLCNRARSRFNTLTGQGVITDLRKALFTHLQNLSFDYYDSRPHGKILVRVVNYVNSVSDFLSNGMVNSLLELISLIFITIYMYVVSPRLATVILAGLPVFALYMFVTKPLQRRMWQRFSNKQSNTTAYLAENINGVRVTQAFSRQDVNCGIFNGLLAETRRAWMHAVYLIHAMWPMTMFLQWAVTAALYITSVYLFREHVSVGVVIAMAAYAGRFWGPITNLGNIYNSLISTVAYLERIFQVLDEPVAITDKPNAVELGAIEGRVEFDHVHFEYEPGHPVLRDVSFSVAPGESIALVGPTGAGKSTIISLLSRFYDLKSGSVRVDGKDLADVTLNSLRSQMGLMLQDTFVFSGTYMSNIRYGRLTATDEQCIAAAKAVHADEFIMDMPDGYKTPISERGDGMSSGQKQLLSFARTMLSDPKILILDEATSSIDTNTELLVQEGIARLLKGRTSFIVAHRLSTIRNCSRILYINDGGIAEMGSHDELIAKGGLYYDLYMSQLMR